MSEENAPDAPKADTNSEEAAQAAPETTPTPEAAEDTAAQSETTENSTEDQTIDLDQWKPEPRTWKWKDIFSAPMLAFKPKCILVAIVTLFAIGLASWGIGSIGSSMGDTPIIPDVVDWVNILVSSIIFSCGATLIAVIMKADLLDDDFPTLKEALGAFKERFVAAVMVPIFLVGVIAAITVVTYLADLVLLVPFIGPIIYAILYPIIFICSIFAVLFFIGVTLSYFVFPSIVAVRKHSWFDNVIDAFEAVGTKPHVIVFSFALTCLMALVAAGISLGGLNYLKQSAASQNLPGKALHATEHKASSMVLYTLPDAAEMAKGGVCSQFIARISNHVSAYVDLGKPYAVTANGSAEDNELARWIKGLEDGTEEIRQAKYEHELEQLKIQKAKYNEAVANDGYVEQTKADYEATQRRVDAFNNHFGWSFANISGTIAGVWQIIIVYAILGYLFNLFIAGGMLTYLNVREDDYWEDEDLDDLDELAKELEEEARKEEERLRQEEEAAKTATPAAEEEKTEDTKEESPAEEAKADDGSNDDAEEKSDEDKKDS